MTSWSGEVFISLMGIGTETGAETWPDLGVLFTEMTVSILRGRQLNDSGFGSQEELLADELRKA